MFIQWSCLQSQSQLMLTALLPHTAVSSDYAQYAVGTNNAASIIFTGLYIPHPHYRLLFSTAPFFYRKTFLMDGTRYASSSTWNGSRNNLPYLIRNIRNVLSARRDSGHGSHQCASGGEDEINAPPRKRQKIDRAKGFDEFTSDFQHYGIAEPSHGLQVHQTGFKPPENVAKRSILQDGILSSSLPTQKALFIDVVEILETQKIGHEASEDVVSALLKTRVSITIFYEPPTNDKNTHVELVKMCRMGTVRVEHGKDRAAVELCEPFLIPAEHLMVNHKVPLQQKSDIPHTIIFKLAERYSVQICLESVGRQPFWPPLRRTASNKRLVLQATSQGTRTEDIRLFSTTTYEFCQHITTDYNVDMIMNAPTMIKRVPCQLKLSVKWSVPPKFHSKFRSVANISEVKVRYHIHREASNEGFQLAVRGYACPWCMRKLSSMTTLRFHITTNHESFRITSVDINLESENIIHLYVLCNIPSDRSRPSDVLQLNPPVTKFNLEDYLNGDLSWISSRRGPLDTSDPILPHNLAPSPSRSHLRNSPGISEDIDIETPPQAVKRIPRKALRVPITKTPMYDLITRRVLAPGEMLPVDPNPDMTWRHQQHADYLDDFSDLTNEEKDYMKKWSTFIATQRITCDMYIPAALLQFVTENKQWFSKRLSRKKEFGKHCAHFLRRRVITSQDMKACTTVFATLDVRESSSTKGKWKTSNV